MDDFALYFKAGTDTWHQPFVRRTPQERKQGRKCAEFIKRAGSTTGKHAEATGDTAKVRLDGVSHDRREKAGTDMTTINARQY